MKRLPLLALLFSAPALGCDGLKIQDGWIREAPPGAMVTAAYAALSNAGPNLLVVTGAFSEPFGGAELHQTVVENGISRMRHGQDLELAPGATVRLEPGGWHLMLFRPGRPLKAGEQIPVVFRCGKRGAEALFTVKAVSE